MGVPVTIGFTNKEDRQAVLDEFMLGLLQMPYLEGKSGGSD